MNEYKKYICDTNFIIRYLIADNDKIFTEAKIIFDKAQNGEVKLLLIESVFTEVIFVLSSFHEVPREKIAEVLSDLVSYKGIVTDKEILIEALQYYKETNLHIVDCILAARTQSKDLELLSFDQQLKKIVQEPE